MIEIQAQPRTFNLPADGSTALVIIDMQRDFVEPGGFGEALGNNVLPLRNIVPSIQRVLELFREKQWPVVHTVEGHHPDLRDCPPSKLNRAPSPPRIGDHGPMGRILILGEPGNGIIPELAPATGEILLTKPGKGAFCRTDLERDLHARGVTHLVFTGVTTEVCVQTTMREANDRGFECLLLEDGTESYFPDFKRSTIEMIRAQGGIVGWTSTSKELIRAVESRGN